VVFEAAEGVLHSEEDARDAAQRVFARLWVSGEWRRIEDPERFFRRAGRNAALTDVRRWRRRRTVHLAPGPVDALRSPRLSPEESLLRSERRDLALRIVGLLPPRCRLVCALVYLEGHTHAEVAERLGISPRAVEKQVARGRQRLRKLAESGGIDVSTFLDGGGVGVFARLGAEAPGLDSISLIFAKEKQL
jgi:RNA polymerase sigma-70 factor (ECF subfamily)